MASLLSGVYNLSLFSSFLTSEVKRLSKAADSLQGVSWLKSAFAESILKVKIFKDKNEKDKIFT